MYINVFVELVGPMNVKDIFKCIFFLSDVGFFSKLSKFSQGNSKINFLMFKVSFPNLINPF